jgi:hypothetical protein
MKALQGVLLFTLVEIVTLVVWLVLAGIPFNGKYLAVVVLAVGLFIEHYISVNVGAGRPPLGPLPPDKPSTVMATYQGERTP